MDSQLSLVRNIIKCLVAGHQVTLVTVVKTWGTSPRPVGSLLAVSSNGEFFGSISGGCIEDELIERLIENPVQAPEKITYGDGSESDKKISLPCGSIMQLLLEPVTDVFELEAIRDAIASRKPLLRRTNLISGETSLRSAINELMPQLSDDAWVNIFGPVWRLLIIGAGDVSVHMANMALTLGYEVTVCDPRPEYALSWPLAHVPIDKQFPDDLIYQLAPDSRMAIAAMSHDPRLDDMALLAALKSDAFYVGVLGSRTTNIKRRDRLREHFDFSQEELDNLHGPIGLSIGSKTPSEIALSALAGITKEKNALIK